ncbi:MAG: sialidase family protein [Planctomycetota bacterium]|nr:sialidase family protein [Planctomycetota bacterium]
MQIVDRGFVFDTGRVQDALKVCSFTSLLQLRDGALLVSCRRGTAKDSADGNVAIFKSTDQGASWSEISSGFVTQFEGLPGEVRSAELAELDDGRLLAVLGWIDRSAGDGVLRDSESDTMPAMHLLQEYSSDGGKSWAGRRVLQRQSVLSGPIVRIGDRGWLVTSEYSQGANETTPRHHAAYAHFSRDGEYFEPAVDVVPGDSQVFYYDQRQRCCPQSGRLAAMFWTYDINAEADIEMHMAWGDAKSLTWSTPRSMGVQGQIAMPIPLADGRLLAFYVHRHTPGSLRLMVSSDQGVTWDRETELVVYASTGTPERGIGDQATYDEFWDAMGTWSFGHPSAAVLADGSLLLVFYAGPNESSLSVHWARVEL